MLNFVSLQIITQIIMTILAELSSKCKGFDFALAISPKQSKGRNTGKYIVKLSFSGKCPETIFESHDFTAQDIQDLTLAGLEYRMAIEKAVTENLDLNKVKANLWRWILKKRRHNVVKVYFSVLNQERPKFSGRNANVWFSDKPVFSDNETVFKTIDMTRDEYNFMVEYWDDTLDRYGIPEVYMPKAG